MGAEKSEAYRTTEGVKQGGVLSPYLFNFFIDEMITSGLAKNTGAKLGKSFWIIVKSTPWIGKWNSIQKSQCIWKLVNIKIKILLKCQA